MCKHGETEKIEIRGQKIRVDKCMKDLIISLNENGITTLMCCCGHGKYPMTVVIKCRKGKPIELFTNLALKRKVQKNGHQWFYKRDKNNMCYIPEIIKKTNS